MLSNGRFFLQTNCKVRAGKAEPSDLQKVKFVMKCKSGISGNLYLEIALSLVN